MRKSNLFEELQRMKSLMVYKNGDYKDYLYEDIKPQESSSSALSFDKTINFAPGYYRKNGPVTTKAGTTYNWDVNETLSDDLSKIKEFLKNNPSGYIVEVNLYSSESQIPNNDNEKGGTKVEQNYLNAARLKSLKEYIEPIFESWKKEGITQTNFKINEFKEIGKTPWVGTPFCPKDTNDPRSCSTTYYNKVKSNDPVALEWKEKYDKEQYFRVKIEVKKIETPQPEPKPEPKPEPEEKITEDCLTGLRIKVDIESHECNNAEFFVYLNDTMLYNVDGGYTANGNNASTFIYSDLGKKIKAKRLNPGYGKLGTKKYGTNGSIGNERYDEFIVTPEQSKEIIKKSNDGKINIWYICTLESGCHLDTPTVSIFKDDEPIYRGKPMSDSSLLVTLDGCGNKTSDKPDETAIEPDVTAMRQKVQSDRMSMVIDDESDVPDEEDTKQKQLKASNTLIAVLNKIHALLQHPSISNIYYERSEKPLKKYQRIGKFKGIENYVNYDIPQNKELFDWYLKKLEDDKYISYIEEIIRIISKNNYYVEDGKFVDKTIRTDKLFGDVRNNLDRFYDEFKILYTMDNNTNEISLRYSDEETPYDYVRQLSKIGIPGNYYSEVNVNELNKTS